MDFLTHYQLAIHYETGIDILSSFKQSSTTHISDQIHEWRRRRRLIKLDLPDQLLAEWFTKLFMNNISHDITMGGVVTEEQAINRMQYLDLIYLQNCTLDNLLPDAPRPSTTATSITPAAYHATYGVIGTFHADTKSMLATHTNPKSTASNVQSAPTPTPSTKKTFEVNSVQSAPIGKNKSKKGKGKNKEDRNNNPQSDKPKTQSVDDKDKHKHRYPFLICGDDHYTKDCPRHAEVTKFLQGTRKLPTPVILSQPFPSQKQAQLVIDGQPSPSTTSYVLMCTGNSTKNDVAITTQAKDYSPSKEKVVNLPPLLVQPPPSTSPPNGPLHLKRLNPDTVLLPPLKGVVQKSAFNPHAHASQNYSIVEDLVQEPSVMSALEVLQSCPAQWKALLKSIGGIDPTITNLIIFDLKYHIPSIPP
jgi:hypothetical protein